VSDIAKGLSPEERKKSEDMIRAFLKTPEGRRAAEVIGGLSEEEMRRIVGSVPSEAVAAVLADPSRLKSALSDPAAAEKLRRMMK
jgi:hypothetical protein